MKSDSHETWKCADPELERQIRCFLYGERSDVPRLQQVGRQRNLRLYSTKLSIPFQWQSDVVEPPPHFYNIQFLAHLAKGHVSFCHHLASVVRRKL